MRDLFFINIFYKYFFMCDRVLFWRSSWDLVWFKGWVLYVWNVCFLKYLFFGEVNWRWSFYVILGCWFGRYMGNGMGFGIVLLFFGWVWLGKEGGVDCFRMGRSSFKMFEVWMRFFLIFLFYCLREF